MDGRSTFLHRCGGFTRGFRRRTVAGVNGYPRYGGRPPDGAWVRPGNAMRPRCPEKVHATDTSAVPKPTQVGGYKDTKARGRNLVKELGNMAP